MITNLIEKAINEEKDLEFSYLNFNGEASRRRVSEIQFCNEYSEFGYENDHIRAYCHLRNEERTFRISRISNAKIITSEITTKPITRTNSTAKPISQQTSPNLARAPTNTRNEGCYLATMVYGDYDHPKVIVLRKFRDNKLSNLYLGNVFIKVYYKISPVLVEKLKGSQRVNKGIKKSIDFLVWIIE